MSSLFTTDKIATTKRFPFWRDMLCGTHASIDCQRLSPRPFSGASESAQVDRVVLTHLHSVDQKIVWTPGRSSSDDGALLVTLQTLGLGVLIQDGREAKLGPGCISVHESGRPFTWIFPDEFEQLIVRIPRDSLAAKLCETRHLTARVINGTSGIGSLVSGFLHQTFAVLGSCSPSAAYHLTKISCDLIHTALSEFQGQEHSQACGQAALLHRAKQVIESNLHDPELNPRTVAGMSRISLRYLQNLFKDENTTPTSWIWERRVKRGADLLSDPLFANTSISEIAFECGFSDYSHFNHRFKAAYSLSPSEYREKQQQGSLDDQRSNVSNRNHRALVGEVQNDQSGRKVVSPEGGVPRRAPVRFLERD
jgi:AraC-like DNA-binding protein